MHRPRVLAAVSKRHDHDRVAGGGLSDRELSNSRLNAVNDLLFPPPEGLLGVLGGMGPAATADFYQKLVAATQGESDAEHVPVIIWGDPRTPDRSDAILGVGVDPTPWLRRGARILRSAGARTIVVPCVTSHFFIREIAAELDLTLIDLVEETAQHAVLLAGTTVGLLATSGTVRAGLFQDALRARGLTPVIPDDDEQVRIMGAIRLVKAGRSDEARPVLLSAAESLARNGADTIIMGCTEVPLGLEGADVDTPLIDPVRIVIDCIVRDFAGAQAS